MLGISCVFLLSAITAPAMTPPSQDPGMAPPAELKQLDFMIGDWSGKETYHLMGAKTDATATVSFKKALGNRYIMMSHTAKMPQVGNTEGLMLITYDPAKKKFISWWFDSAGPGTVESEGSLEMGSLTSVSKPTMLEGMGTAAFRSTFTLKGEREMTFHLEMKSGADWTTFIEGSYKKK